MYDRYRSSCHRSDRVIDSTIWVTNREQCSIAQPSSVVQQSIANAQQNGRYLDLDERETRRLIDAQLRSSGWEADTEEIRYSQGTRPVKGRYLAIAEWPTASLHYS